MAAVWTRGRVWAVTGVLLVGAAACGSGSGGPSKADYVRKVSALCRESAAERRTLVPNSGSSTPQHLVDVLQRSVAVDEQLEQRISALEPPKGDAETIRRLLALMKQSDQLTLRLVVTIQHNDVKGFTILDDELTRMGPELTRMLTRYGLTACVTKQ